MEADEIVVMILGFGLPVVAAPLVSMALRPLFALFLTEGSELFGDIPLPKEDARAVAAVMSRINIAVLLLAWLGLFTCHCFSLPVYLIGSIGLLGVGMSLLMTTMIVRSSLGIEGRTMAMIGLLAFAGGNLPLIVMAGTLMVIFTVK